MHDLGRSFKSCDHVFNVKAPENVQQFSFHEECFEVNGVSCDHDDVDDTDVLTWTRQDWDDQTYVTGGPGSALELMP